MRLARFTLEEHAYGASRLPKTTVLQSRPARLPLHANVYSDFTFRGRYCLGSFTLQDFFQVLKYLLSREKIRTFPSERFSLLACTYCDAGPGPTVIRTVCKR